MGEEKGAGQVSAPGETGQIWTFTNGKLEEMTLDLSLSTDTFDQFVADVSKKLSAKPVLSHPTMQNAMGANWADDDAVWSTPELHANLHESHNPASPTIRLVIETRAKHDKEALDHAKSPLD